MTKIADAARITKQGRVQSAKALAAIVSATHECAGTDCTNQVVKAGNWCSVACATAPVIAAKAHTAPCGDKACIDTECQARALIRAHMLTNMSEQDRIKSSDAIIAALHSLLADPQHATEDPEFFALMAVDLGVQNANEGVHVQAELAKPVAAVPVVKPDSPAKIRKPQVAKHKPRTTDGQVHPVVVTPTRPQEAQPVSKQPKSSKSFTQADMDRAVRSAIDAEVERRVQAILDAKQVQVPDVDRPIVMVGHKGPNMVVERGDANREGKGVVLPGFVVDNTLSIDPLDLGDLTLDAVVVSATRSGYNKARFRLAGEPVLPKDCTYRTLAVVHADLLKRATAKRGERKTEAKTKVIEQAKAVGNAPSGNKTHVWKGKPVTAKQHAYYTRNQQPAVAAVVEPDAKAKVSTTDKTKIRAVMEVMGVSKKAAKALLSL